MNREDIIRMAREAGFNTDHDLICIEGWEISPYMQRFAALVAAEKDKEIQKLRNELAVTNKALDAAIDFAGSVCGSSSWWEEVWPEHEAAIDASR